MGDDNRPNLTLVPETPGHEREKEQARRELAWDTREMAANLLRIIRGAGRPSELPQQIINLSEAILKVHKECRAWAIWSAMEDTLHSGVPSHWDAPESTRHESTIAKGALQLVASRLVHQRAQEAAGGREIDEGIDELQRARERMRKRWQAEYAEEALQRAQRALRTRKKTAKPKRRVEKAADRQAAPADGPATTPVPTDEAEEKPKSTAEWMKAQRKRLRGDEQD